MTEALFEAEATRADMPEPKRVLFVCTGNTCRSPMASAILNDLSIKSGEPSFSASSCGIMANEGEPMSSGAISALVRANIGGAHTLHEARQVSRGLIERADIIIGITERHAEALSRAFPEYESKIYSMPRDISDPYGGDAAVYDACLSELAGCIKEMFGFGA